MVISPGKFSNIFHSLYNVSSYNIEHKARAENDNYMLLLEPSSSSPSLAELISEILCKQPEAKQTL